MLNPMYDFGRIVAGWIECRMGEIMVDRLDQTVMQSRGYNCRTLIARDTNLQSWEFELELKPFESRSHSAESDSFR